MNRPLLFFTFYLVCTNGRFFGHRSILPTFKHDKNYPGQCTDTDQATTKGCLDSYFRTYGIDSSKGIPPFADYIKKVNTVMDQYGATAIDFYCDFESTLESCLGDLLASPCMNPDAFTKMYGINESESIDYATSYAVEAYTCQNKETVKPYFSCLSDVDTDLLSGVVQCTDQLQNALQNEPDVCVPIDTCVSCVEDYYVKFCDEGIRSYICNTQEIMYNFGMNGNCADQMHKC